MSLGGLLSSRLLDGASVHRLAKQRRHNGRPWSVATAWAGLAVLYGESADWQGSSAMSRLRHRLRRGADLYVRARGFTGLVTTLSLVEESDGDVTVRVVPDDAGYP